MDLLQVAIIVLAVWLLIITFYLIKINRFFVKLSLEVKKGNLIEVLDKVMSNEAKNAGDLNRLEKELKKVTENALGSIQKVGFVRFNPFSELGGDHSFSIALLDGYENGVVLTGLHTRERTRVYMKNVIKGKCKYQLSREEKKALTKAQKSK